MGKLRLSLACWNYDRTRALMEERVPVDGVELNYLSLPVERRFFRMMGIRNSTSRRCRSLPTCCRCFKENPPFIAIPVFPSRFFRHSCVFINRHSGILEPKDLAGKRVGTPEYQLTGSCGSGES